MAFVIATVVGLSSSTSVAELLVQDNFNRPDGNLVGTTPTPGPGGTWVAHSGTNGPVQISSNRIVIVQNASTVAAEDVNVPTGTAMGAGDLWYAAFDVTVDQPGDSIASVAFAHFLQGTTFFTSRIWVTTPTTSGYRFALSNDNSITDDDGEVFSSDLVLGQPYRVVVSYDYTAQSGTLWIDPVDQSSPSITATDPGFSNAVSAFAFRQGSPSGFLTTTQTIDNLCVATSFDEALNCAPSDDLQILAATAAPNPVAAGDTVLLTATVAGGTPPYSVTADLSAIGGSSNQVLFDDGTNGDSIPGDNIFSYSATLPCNNPVGNTGGLPVTAMDSASPTPASANSSINLTVTDGATTIVQHPSSATHCPGETARFRVRATGAGLTYQWHDSTGALVDGGNISGANEDVLVISNVQAADAVAGPYHCVVSGICGGQPTLATDQVTLTIGSPVTAHDRQIVINQVYGGGGNGGATYTHDYIELFNNGTTAVDVTGWTIQYASSGAGLFSNFEVGDLGPVGEPRQPRLTVLSGTIQPGRYFLIQEGQGAGGDAALPLPDVDGTNLNAHPQGPIQIAATTGKIALVNVSTPLSGTCPNGNGPSPDACNVVDFVGWGADVSCAEGGNPGPGTGNTTAIIRESACVDSDDNSDDFTTITAFQTGVPNPRNSSSSNAPFIASHPTSQTICEGESATFIVGAHGPCLEYQWQVNTGAGFVNVTTGTGGDTASYTTEPLTSADHGNQYRCLVSNDFGSPAVLTNAATLSVGLTLAEQQVVISQVYGAGGNQGAEYRNDFVELYNRGTTPVDLNGWSVQYASFNGVSWNRTNLSGVIDPGQYYLIQQAAGTGGTIDLPAPDAIGTVNMSGERGKVALVKTAETLLAGTSCPPLTDCRVVDFVGYGSGTDCFLGTGSAPYQVNNIMAARRTPLCSDTKDNADDFLFTLVNPKGIPGDLDRDGDVDSGPGSDLEIFAACATGATVPYDPQNLPPGCTLVADIHGIIEADMDRDGDVDMDDYALLQGCMVGEGEPGNPACTCP